MPNERGRLWGTRLLAVLAVLTAACGSEVSAGTFKSDFSTMKSSRSLAAAGRGKVVAVILPGPGLSGRYVEFDAPYFQRAFSLAGVPSGEYLLQVAQGGATDELREAETDIANGASVLILVPLDPNVTQRIESDAISRGVKVLDYDQLGQGGSPTYLVGFGPRQTGKLIGDGLIRCISDWKVREPRVLLPTGSVGGDALYNGYYDDALQPLFRSGKYQAVNVSVSSSDPSAETTQFQSSVASNPNANAALVPSDEVATSLIAQLQRRLVTPETFPITGAGATIAGLHSVLAGYQCGTTYEPIYKEVQAAATLSLYLRANQTPPSTLLNGSVSDPVTHSTVRSILLTPVWVTTKNMKSTVVADGFVPVSSICEGAYSVDCRAAGVLP